MKENCAFFVDTNLSTSKFSLILYEELLKKPLLFDKTSYLSYLKMVELINDNELGIQKIPYTIPFITGIWHKKLCLDIS